MSDWQPHHGKGYPFELLNPDGTAKEQPTILARIRALDRATVEEKGNWLPATAWKTWKHNGGPGDIMEFQRRDR